MRLSKAASVASTVTVATATESGDTATPGTDYTAISSQTVNFAAGETSKTVTVKVKSDSTAESDETFTLKILSATGANLGTPPR